jgi:hypothetical protein
MNISILEKKYGRSFVSFNEYMTINYKDLNYKDLKFTLLRGLLYEFFESNNIMVSVYAFDFENPKWTFRINIDNYEIIDGDYAEKIMAEFIAFDKCFEFLNTRLFINEIYDNLHEDSSDISVLKFNWNHLDKVLKNKRQKNK